MTNGIPGTRTIDVYALIDAGSEESRQFSTYSFYWRQLERAITDAYGRDPAPAIVQTITGSKPFRALSSSQYSGDPAVLAHLLHNSWSNELMLYAVDENDPRLLTSVQWQNVYTYYATGMSALAWLCVRDGVAPKAHRQLLNGLASQVAMTQLFPEPWNLHLLAAEPLTWGGFASPPNDCHNLSAVHLVPALDGIGKMLKTTRGNLLDAKLAEERAKHGGRVPRGTRSRLDVALSPTTTFDFAWRSRTRANYGSPAMFFKGALGDIATCLAYVQALRFYADATMLIFEAFVGQRARRTLVDAATEFISRDRSRQSDVLVGRRLRELGYLR